MYFTYLQITGMINLLIKTNFKKKGMIAVTYELGKNSFKEAISKKQVQYGIFVETPAISPVEIAAIAGADFIRLDWCHAPLDLSMIAAQVIAAERYGIIPMVRIDYDPYKISYCLDLGVMGIIVPDVSTAAKARDVVKAARFSPIGDRSMFAINRKSGYGAINAAEFKEWSNNEVIICIQIESKEAIENLDEILEIESIDLIMSGRGDLANSLGVPGQKTHPIVLEAEEKLFAKALAKGKHISVTLDPFIASFTDEIKSWKQKGACVFSLGMDHTFLKKSLENAFIRAKLS